MSLLPVDLTPAAVFRRLGASNRQALTCITFVTPTAFGLHRYTAGMICKNGHSDTTT
jgi:hypothetical protein